jgi:hypothetical protein
MSNKYDSLIVAIEAGANMAGGLKSGDQFIGAMDAASQLYCVGSKEYDCFISGYIAALNTVFPNGIKCNVINNQYFIN